MAELRSAEVAILSYNSVKPAAVEGGRYRARNDTGGRRCTANGSRAKSVPVS
jgi:hypothetical protein